MFENKFAFNDGVLSRVDGKVLSIGIDSKGYQYVCTSKGRVFVHRVIFWLVNGYLPEYIDHINGDKLDNRPSNLRECNLSQNNRNVGIRNDNSSGFKGVTWNKSAKKWHAQIKVDGKSVYLGVFADAIDAAKAYDKAAIEHHGEFAMTNKKLLRY